MSNNPFSSVPEGGLFDMEDPRDRKSVRCIRIDGKAHPIHPYDTEVFHLCPKDRVHILKVRVTDCPCELYCDCPDVE